VDPYKLTVIRVLGLKTSADPPVFYLRLMRFSNADVLWTTRDEIFSHPGGTSHLSVFNSLVEEYGLKPNPSVLALMVPNAEPDSEEERVIGHIVGYDDSSRLYLMKWQDHPYQDATWDHEVQNEHAIEDFRRREQYKQRVSRPGPRAFQGYGTGEGCLLVPEYRNGNTLTPDQVHALNWFASTTISM
jgi:hypothetical protein